MLDETFRVVRRSRPFALVAPGFEVVSGAPSSGELGLADEGPVAPFAAVELSCSRTPLHDSASRPPTATTSSSPGTASG